MVVTTYGKESAAIRLGSDIPFVKYIAIGSGSGAVAVGNNTLVAETDRNVFTSTSFATARKFNFVADFNSIEISGTNLREFGVVASGAAGTGSVWQREGFANIAFDGTNELKVDITWEQY